MSAGNFIGAVWNTIILGLIWVVLGYPIEKLFRAFNFSISLLPTFQDAVNGFSILQYVWIAIGIIIFGVIWGNYLFNENSQASGGV